MRITLLDMNHMNRSLFLLAVALVLAFTPTTTNGLAQEPMEYPETKRGQEVDDFFGTSVADPFRWLEDDVRESDEVADWVEAQNKVTNKVIQELPYRAEIESRLTKLWDYEKYGVPFKRGDRYFYYKNDGLQNQSVLYKLEKLDGEPTVLVIQTNGPKTAPTPWAAWSLVAMENTWPTESRKPDPTGGPGRFLKSPPAKCFPMNSSG